MIEFRIGGRKVSLNNVGDALMRAMLENIEAQIRENIGSIRDPETGEFPTVIVKGDDLQNLEIKVEGSPELIEIVKRRLGDEFEEDGSMADTEAGTPEVFLCYGSEDMEIAEPIANALQANGINTWWDNWCIGFGDSFRQKIDEGLGGCTHFLVLLTPQSISKPWVNQEMDAGLVRKLNNECIFLPLRHGLSPRELPPLLSGIHAPEVVTHEDIVQLINNIHGVSRKPPLGPAPQAVSDSVATKTGYSAAASSVARWFVENTKNALFADPQINIEGLAKATGLTENDVKDALFELSSFFKGGAYGSIVRESMFTEFDQYWMPWDTEEDALKLAADAQNDPDFPSKCEDICERYGWETRRLNPVIAYLLEWRIVFDRKCMGTEFVMPGLLFRKDELRRFVKSRS